MKRHIPCPDCGGQARLNSNGYDFFYECECSCLMEKEGIRVGDDYNGKIKPKEIEYDEDWGIGIDNRAYTYKLPKCPSCGKSPTYDMNPCPYCGQRLIYPDR